MVPWVGRGCGDFDFTYHSLPGLGADENGQKIRQPPLYQVGEVGVGDLSNEKTFGSSITEILRYRSG